MCTVTTDDHFDDHRCRLGVTTVAIDWSFVDNMLGRVGAGTSRDGSILFVVPLSLDFTTTNADIAFKEFRTRYYID